MVYCTFSGIYTIVTHIEVIILFISELNQEESEDVLFKQVFLWILLQVTFVFTWFNCLCVNIPVPSIYSKIIVVLDAVCINFQFLIAYIYISIMSTIISFSRKCDVPIMPQKFRLVDINNSCFFSCCSVISWIISMVC